MCINGLINECVMFYVAFHTIQEKDITLSKTYALVSLISVPLEQKNLFENKRLKHNLRPFISHSIFNKLSIQTNNLAITTEHLGSLHINLNF